MNDMAACRDSCNTHLAANGQAMSKVLVGFVQMVASFDPKVAQPQWFAAQKAVVPAVSHEKGMRPNAARATLSRSRIKVAFAATPYVEPKFLRRLLRTAADNGVASSFGIALLSHPRASKIA